MDDRLRGHYPYPVDWFVTGELTKGATNETAGVFIYKLDTYGRTMWQDFEYYGIYIPFKFEGKIVQLRGKL